MADDYSDLTYNLAGLKRQNPYDQRRKYGYAQLQAGMDASPIQSPWQGAARLAQALVGGWTTGQADRDEAASVEKQSGALAAAMAEPDPQKRIALLSASNPELGARLSGQMAIEQDKIDRQQKGLQTGAGSFGQSFGTGNNGLTIDINKQPGTSAAPPGFDNNVGNIRVSNASWQDRGQPHNGFETFNTPDAGARAMYQNLSSYAQKNPSMTVGQAIATWAPPSENNTQAYVQRIAQAGIDPNTPLASVLGDPSVAGKLMLTMGMHEKGKLPAGFTPDTFMAAAGGQPQLAQGGGQQIIPQGDNPQAAPGMPPQPTAQGVQGPAVTAPAAVPGVPQVPFPQPSPQMLQQYQQRITSGEFGRDPAQAIPAARAALQAELKQQWEYDRHLAEKRSDRQFDEYKDERKRTGDLPQENIKNEAKMREQFDMLQSVKDYRKANTVFRSAVDASKVDSAAADLNMVYAFATLMDPGSVVRDSETQMVTATQNATDRIKALVATVSGGSRLSPDARSALLNEMGSRYQAYKTAHDDLSNTFKGISERSGANPHNVVVPYPEVQYDKTTPKQMPGAKTGGATEYEFRGGKLVPRK